MDISWRGEQTWKEGVGESIGAGVGVREGTTVGVEDGCGEAVGAENAAGVGVDGVGRAQAANQMTISSPDRIPAR